MAKEMTRAERIAKARADLAARYEADPDGVACFEARKARLAAVQKRERDRVNTLVLGRKPEPVALPKKPAGMSRVEWKAEKARLRTAAIRESSLAEKWRGIQGTPETLEHAERTHVDCLDQMERNGSIDKEQREWAAEIANVYRSIESDVAVIVASLEARVDNGGGRSNRVAESVRRVRLHRAYTHWRDTLPPLRRQMILDMIVGDAIGYTVAAARYHVRPARAKAVLIRAIDHWPTCVTHAYREVDGDVVERLNAA